MSYNSIIQIPPKSLSALVERARRMDGCVMINGSNPEIFEFPQGNNVACIIGLECAVGHVRKDARRAEELRRIIAGKTEDIT